MDTLNENLSMKNPQKNLPNDVNMLDKEPIKARN